MYINETLKKFLLDLASYSPTPGGGSVAALTGALSAGLISMVCNFSQNKEKKEITEIFNVSEDLREKMMDLIEKDIESYKEVSMSFKLPKGTQTQKEDRKKAIEVSLKKATEVPMLIISAAFQILILSHKLVEIGNPRLISDIGIAIILADATIQSAKLNVKINLAEIKDSDFKQTTLDKLNYFLKESKEIKVIIKEQVEKRIN